MNKVFFEKSCEILTENRYRTPSEDIDIITFLEDTVSPARNVYINKLYESILEKKHVDFGDIPKSKGNIQNYSGYDNIVEVLSILNKLGKEEKSQDVLTLIETIQTSITNMISLKSTFENGFRSRNEYVILEYNTYTYTIIQAVSSILYEYVDYIKRPDAVAFDIKLKNTKYRANMFYIDQLKQFNTINKTMKYEKYLHSLITGDKQNFTGVEALGLGLLVAVALAIVPTTRELIYHFYNTKSKVSDMLAQQAYFLELNKTVVEANTSFTKEKRATILAKQEKVKNTCLRLSEKLRVEQLNTSDNTKESLKKDNKLLTIDNIKREVDSSSITLL